ncbi:sensor histidine kinase [Amycolatopsis sp., V23-08]|uniref:Oxygen sensor histidine kinase NreB n=1 Tax=Amycolatopsis heterodermiae TaxID=3110235 RepID=A0ABU5QYX7_9PSEU|nr:sensor histidine kinase [Amycolatopsis sp., V23-08]MEA5358799.1 sensor histidine kinase [Amycolatopsis sp., V23-08]
MTDARWLAAAMHSAFFLLVLASAIRYLTRHEGTSLAPWVITLTAALVVAYGVGIRSQSRLWLIAVLAIWVVLVVLAPSFAWSAIPLFVTGLRTLPTGPALGLVGVVTALVVVSQNRLADGFDPNLTIVPIAIAVVTAAVITFMRRQTVRLRESERRAGVLAERHRVSRDIHDALAQGLSSQAMLLQAADQAWDRPELAREHLRSALRVGAGNLSEARRLVQDLAPADLADATLDEALRAVAGRAGLPAEVRVDGTSRQLPERVQSALVRIAQGALANALEHADAGRAVVTLTYLDDQVVLDVADDGRGFALKEQPPGERGHGLPAMRARAQQLGGRLTVESAPGQGTVISAAIPLETAP